MKKIVSTGIIVLALFCNNCYSQDSISKIKNRLPKNHIKFNFLPVFVHTISFSYEREIAKRFSIEFEGGYIFPFGPLNHFNGYRYHDTPSPLWASQGYLGRGSLRYFLIKDQNFIFFAGVSFLYKYRNYNNKLFYETWYAGRSSDPKSLQSEKNIAYAGEVQGGVRIYFPSSGRHLLMEISLAIGYGKEDKTTYVIQSYGSRYPNKYYPQFNPIEQTLAYFSFNPCFKLGYAF
jgi:hypothetical protein